MKLLKKISVKTVVGGRTIVLERVLSDRTRSHPLMRVVGKCNGTQTGQTSRDRGVDNPDSVWTALKGNFEAMNLETGELFRSGKVFLPTEATDMIAGKLDDDVTSVEFAFDVLAKFDESSATSYVYEAVSLIELAVEGDPLDKLMNSFDLPANLLTADPETVNE